jgi:hypothetical protein
VPPPSPLSRRPLTIKRRVSFHVTAPRRPHQPVRISHPKGKTKQTVCETKRRNTLLGDRDDANRGRDGILRRCRRRRVAVGDVPERAATAALGARRRGSRRAPCLGAHLVVLLLVGGGAAGVPAVAEEVRREVAQIQTLCAQMDRLWRSIPAKGQRDLWKR